MENNKIWHAYTESSRKRTETTKGVETTIEQVAAHTVPPIGLHASHEAANKTSLEGCGHLHQRELHTCTYISHEHYRKFEKDEQKTTELVYRTKCMYDYLRLYAYIYDMCAWLNIICHYTTLCIIAHELPIKKDG